ncbi:hypothetical protein Ddye_029022 [Dipteronia dyeriana]|uniref:Uncharacterized protein n=1 Tax=Dipteronia dyeriana TaxID=168575 RepID=A0AAD9WL96_9ROSI|nr:hypothetical protein Ddye_029022 [Dipteronia dyeriana]
MNNFWLGDVAKQEGGVHLMSCQQALRFQVTSFCCVRLKQQIVNSITTHVNASAFLIFTNQPVWTRSNSYDNSELAIGIDIESWVQSVSKSSRQLITGGSSKPLGHRSKNCPRGLVLNSVTLVLSA